jgi:membrane carboxypeptidase/penicillin-binding protein PbpC
MNNTGVCESLKRDARVGNAPERAEMSRESMWESSAALGQDGKPQNVRCAQKMRRVSMMWKCGGSGARKGAELAMK